jgi:hypothetical protein
MELYAEVLSYNKIHEELNSQGRVSVIIHNHNASVNHSGFCEICKRAEGEYSRKAVKRGIARKEKKE